MRDFTNPETVEEARASLVAEADPSLVCEFLDLAEAQDEDASYELDGLLSQWIQARRGQTIGRTVSTRYGSTPEAAREAFDATPTGQALGRLLEG